MTKRLSDFKVLTFDCYGTLIDWETGIWDALQPLLAAKERPDIARDDALEVFGAFENRQESETPGLPYPEVLARVHAAVAAHFDLRTDSRLDGDFGQSLPHWPAFADSAAALRYLKTRYKLVILSNVHRDGFAASNRKLGVEFDAIYTAEDIGAYKPSPTNFEYLLAHLRDEHRLDRKDILHTAQSLFHDHVPARSFGLANAWIDRQHLSESGIWGATARVERRPEIDWRFFSMKEMADAVRALPTA